MVFNPYMYPTSTLRRACILWRHTLKTARTRLKLIAASILVCALPAVPAMAQTAAKPKVALVMKSLANEFFLTMENGAKAHQKANAPKYDLVANGIKDETDTEIGRAHV